MPRKEKSPKKKTKEKSPKKRDLEDPAMQDADINRILKDALDQANAKSEQKLKEQLKELEDRHPPRAKCANLAIMWLLVSYCR